MSVQISILMKLSSYMVRLNKLDIFAIGEGWLSFTWNDHEY